VSDGHHPPGGYGTSGGDGCHHHHQPPPSAAGHLEPYGVRVNLRPATAGLDPQLFLVDFLEGLAAGCMAAGATVIGHLKCLMHLPGGGLACNLTSLRAGAACSARGIATPAALPPGETTRLDLAVLAYGLSSDTIDALVRAGLSRLLDPSGVSWSFVQRV
jgi:hypothetical protein